MHKRKKVKQVVALSYQKERDRAPIVTASGQGLIAEKILSLAEEHGIPIEKNPSLAKALRKLSPGQEIPPDLYEAIAVLLVHVLELDKKAGEKYKA